MFSNKKAKEFMNYFLFLKEIVKRDLKKKYYGSVLGILWSMLSPLGTLIIITIVFSSIFQRNIPFYPSYWFSGNLIFTLVTGGSTAAMSSITLNAGLIKKMKIPKYFFCLSSVILHLIMTLFSTIPYIIVSIALGVPVTFYWLLMPVPIIYAFIFTLGLGMILCAYGTFLKDLNHLYGVITKMWMYMTPLFYPIDIVPTQFRFIWELNPIYIFISIFRDFAIYQTMPSERMFIIATCYSVITLMLGIVVFKEKENKFILYI